MADQSDNAPNCVHATPEMITAGRAALLRLVAEDDIRNDPDWIVKEVWEAMSRSREGSLDIEADK